AGAMPCPLHRQRWVLHFVDARGPGERCMPKTYGVPGLGPARPGLGDRLRSRERPRVLLPHELAVRPTGERHTEGQMKKRLRRLLDRLLGKETERTAVRDGLQTP